MWCAPLRAPGGAWSDVQHHAPALETREVAVVQFRPNADRGSDPQRIAAGRFLRDLAVELPATRRVAVRATVRAKSDAWALVALRPVPGSEETLVVAARMNAR
ncbi:MAG: hypothetical protein AAGB93_24635 [Planctomycetota bacterium]